MLNEKKQVRTNAADSQQEDVPRRGMREFVRRVKHPAGSVLVVALALLLLLHWINGKNGYFGWQQKRAEDQRLRKDINSLEQENARLRQHVEGLRSNNPDAIGVAAHEQLHYVKPNEVIVPLPPEKPAQAQSAGSGK
jgi:cell division protein FtsB